jgi:hypothetical protein
LSDVIFASPSVRLTLLATRCDDIGSFPPAMLKTANMNAMVAYGAVPRRAPEELHVNFAEGVSPPYRFHIRISHKMNYGKKWKFLALYQVVLVNQP